LRGGAIALSFGLAVAGTTANALTISGQITNPGAYTVGQLQGLGNVSETIGGNSYVGVSLWSLLGGTGSGTSNVITAGGGNNPILRNYVLATDTNGSISAVSLGELDPLFGGTGLPYLVAYQRNGVTLATPALIVPQDLTGTRNIVNLANLSVSGVSRPPVGPGGTTSQFTLSGVGAPGTFDLAALQALPATTTTTSRFSAESRPTDRMTIQGSASGTCPAAQASAISRPAWFLRPEAMGSRSYFRWLSSTPRWARAPTWLPMQSTAGHLAPADLRELSLLGTIAVVAMCPTWPASRCSPCRNHRRSRSWASLC
jgi:hypothetical protein